MAEGAETAAVDRAGIGAETVAIDVTVAIAVGAGGVMFPRANRTIPGAVSAPVLASRRMRAAAVRVVSGATARSAPAVDGHAGAAAGAEATATVAEAAGRRLS